jgi:hypothetical protein
MDPDAVIRELLLINAAPALTARCRFNSEQSTGHVAPGSYRRCSHCGKDEAGGFTEVGRRDHRRRSRESTSDLSMVSEQ